MSAEALPADRLLLFAASGARRGAEAVKEGLNGVGLRVRLPEN